MDHPNLAHNTHIVAWDSLDNSFKVMKQPEVQELIANHHMLKNDKIYAVGTMEEYIEGSRDLESILQSTSRRSEEKFKPVLRDIFEEVAAMNREQIVHRDLKAANIIIIPTTKAKVIDFGSAAIQAPGESLPFFGDRSIHPPESYFKTKDAAQRTSQKTDSYSLFLLTYRAPTGESFFESKTRTEVIIYGQKTWVEKQKSHSFYQLLDKDPKLTDVSSELKGLMANLGTANETQRFTVQQVLAHPFFANREVSQLNVA